MKKKRLFKYMLVELLVTTVLVGCSSVKYYSENDLVKNIQKTTYITRHEKNERHEPTYWQNYIFTNEVNKNTDKTITIYDIITMPMGSYDLEEQAYIVLDGTIVELDNIEYRSNSFVKKSEIKEEIMLADSTKTTVLKGYKTENLKTVRMKHPINEELASRIMNAEKIYFRYYAGPGKLTTDLTPKQLKKLKKLIAQ
ncbi:MAG: hypothetical protein ACK5KP_02625 [Paludibacteraceae bacterium]